jgi:homoserine dehydrogenase
MGQVASRHYLRFALHERPELLTCLQSWLTSMGANIEQWAHVQHPQDDQQDALVVLTQRLTGDALTSVLDALLYVADGIAPAAVWRVEDMNE